MNQIGVNDTSMSVRSVGNTERKLNLPDISQNFPFLARDSSSVVAELLVEITMPSHITQNYSKNITKILCPNSLQPFHYSSTCHAQDHQPSERDSAVKCPKRGS